MSAGGLRVAIDATALLNPVQGGIARYTRSLVEALRDAGELASIELRYRLSRWKRRDQLPDLAGLRGRWSLGAWWPPGPRVDVVHDTDARSPRARGAARVATLHDVFSLISQDFASQRFRRHKAERYATLVRDCQRIVAVSASTRDDFLRLFPACPEERVAVVHEGVDPRFRRPPDERIAGLAERLGLDRPYLLFVGELSARKNLVRMLAAFERSGLDDHAFVLAGAGTYGFEEVRAAARRPALGDRVRMVGHVTDDDLPALYAGAAALCFATLYEGFGLPVLEAMRCGTPVLTSTVGASPEIAGGHAILADPEDVEALAGGMQRALEIGEGQRQAAQAHAAAFTWEACARATRVVYQDALGM